MLLQLIARPIDFRVLILAVATWALGAGIFFREPLLASFDMVFGDPVDGSLIIYLHEHLVRAIAGRAQLLSPAFFHPQTNVLGFTDAFLLDIIPYGAFRSLGVDLFLSSQLMLFVLSFACFACTLVICVRYLAVRPAVALCAAALITFPNNLFYQATAGHLNFFALYYVPCIALLALWGLDGFPQLARWSFVRVGIAAMLFGLLFATAFYIAWLLALTMLIAGCTAAILLRQHLVTFARTHSRVIGTVLAAAGAGFVIGLIPFLLIYLPALSIVPGRTYGEYLYYAPKPPDVINVSTGNLLWGWLVQHLSLRQGHEPPIATTPAMTAIALILAFLLRRREKHAGGASWQGVFAIAGVSVWSGAWLLTAKIGTVSLFWLAFQLLPGASAIRSGGRIQLIVNIWIVLALAVLLTRWIETAPAAFKARTKLLASGVALLCLVEQVNILHAAQLPRTEKLAWLAAVPLPPTECQSFLVDPLPYPLFYETDAMWMTFKTGLPTLNGMSGWQPPGWLLQIPSIEYFDAARRWIALRKLDERVCLYERQQRRWSRFDRN